MDQTAKLIVDGKTYELPLIVGSEGERAVDITTLRRRTGLITYDPGYANTGSCKSSITFMDGEKGSCATAGIPWRNSPSIPPLWKRPTCLSTASSPHEKN
jgi:citrate synthase